MKKSKIVFSKKYKRINKIIDIIDAFNIFEILQMEGLTQIKEYIEEQMKYYGMLGKIKEYDNMSIIKQYYIKYSVYKINNNLPIEYIESVEKFKKALLNKNSNESNLVKNCYFYSNIINDVMNKKDSIYHSLINPNDNLSYHINCIAKIIDIQGIDIAVGFLFDSGLQKISETIDRIFQNDNKIRCIIGSLQNYYKSTIEKPISININENTIDLLNYYSTLNLQIRTLKEKFYHGKIYILKGKNIDCIIIGSSNISASAFCSNYELNELVLCNNICNEYQNYFDSLWNKCYSIDIINPSRINCIPEGKYDNSFYGMVSVDEKYVQDNIMSKTNDAEVLRRFEIWRDREPDEICINLKIGSLPDYIAFIYYEYNLIVLDSIYSKNGYYYFYDYKIDNLIELIKNATKTEIFKLSTMKKRGYHINNMEKLEDNIEKIFIKC